MMPSLTAIVCCALLFIVLGLMWLLGCSFFERKAPQLLVYFGFAFMVIRAQVVLTLVGVHALPYQKAWKRPSRLPPWYSSCMG